MIELKSTINELIEQLAKMLKISIPLDLVAKNVVKFYDKGLLNMEVQFEMNFLRDDTRIDTLQKYVYDNIQGFNEQMIEQLRKEVTQSVVNLESTPKLMERIKKIEDMSIDRAKMIARTELNRAENMGHIDGARQSGLILMKQWNAQPERTSRAGNKVPCPICESLDGQTIPMDKHFKYQGKIFDAPPAHPNCACTLLFIQK